MPQHCADIAKKTVVGQQLRGHQEHLREGSADAAHALWLGAKYKHGCSPSNLNIDKEIQLLVLYKLIFAATAKSVDVSVREIEEM